MGHGPSLYPWAENIALRDAAGLAFFSHVSRGAAHISQKEEEEEEEEMQHIFLKKREEMQHIIS